MKLVALTCLFLASVNLTHGQSVTGAEIVEFGKFKAEQVGTSSVPQTTLGRINETTQEVLVEKTTKIEANLGTRFGIRIKLVGEPRGKAVNCIIRGIHPKFTDPATGRDSEIDQWETEKHIGEAEYVGFTFEYKFELVPGKWTFQVLWGSEVVAEKAFDVTIARDPSDAVQGETK